MRRVRETLRYRADTLRNRLATWRIDNGQVVHATVTAMKIQLYYLATLAYSALVTAWICYACGG